MQAINDVMSPCQVTVCIDTLLFLKTCQNTKRKKDLNVSSYPETTVYFQSGFAEYCPNVSVHLLQ